MDETNLPSENQPSEPSAIEVARATAAAIIEQQQTAAEKSYVDQYRIVDPGQQPVEKTEKPAEKPAETKAEEPVEKPAEKPAEAPNPLLERIAALERQLQEREEPSAFQPFAFDPYTGKPMGKTPEAPVLGLPTKHRNPATGEEEEIEWEPAVVDAFKQRDEKLREALARIDKMEAAHQAQIKQIQEQRAQAVFDEFDAIVAADTDMHDVLGSGGRTVASKAELSHRCKIIDAMNVIPGNVPMKEKYERAKAMLYPDRNEAKIAAKKEKEISDKVRSANGRFISKPSPARNIQDMPKTRDRALAAIGEVYRKHGVDELE